MKLSPKNFKMSELDILFDELGCLEHERRIEKVQWDKYGKGINSDNISMFDKKIKIKKEEILLLRQELLNKNIKISEIYNFTYFFKESNK